MKYEQKRGGDIGMDFATIIQAIGSCGFPIIMCLVMAWYIKQLNAEHKEESFKFTEALNNNTLVLQKLCDKMGE